MDCLFFNDCVYGEYKNREMLCDLSFYGFIIATVGVGLYFLRQVSMHSKWNFYEIDVSDRKIFIYRKYAQGGQFTKDVRADGKVIIITGCNTGKILI